jgi:hypothetical protein
MFNETSTARSRMLATWMAATGTISSGVRLARPVCSAARSCLQKSRSVRLNVRGLTLQVSLLMHSGHSDPQGRQGQ